MPNLVAVSLYDVDSRILELLSMLSGSLVKLRLEHTCTTLRLAPQSTATDIALFKVFEKHTRLQTLELGGFEPSADFGRTAALSKTRFPSLRHLHLTNPTEAAFDFPYIFPHLSLLSLTIEYFTRPRRDQDDFLRWPPLQELYLEQISLARCVHCRLGQVDTIGIAGHLGPGDAWDLQESFSAMLCAASPITLALSLGFVPGVIGMLAPTLLASLAPATRPGALYIAEQTGHGRRRQFMVGKSTTCL